MPWLLYATVYGNPCENLDPVLQVPMLYFDGGRASQEQLIIVENWMENQRPDVEEYSCVNYSEADLDGGEYYHVIHYEQNGAARQYRINDSTGELED